MSKDRLDPAEQQRAAQLHAEFLRRERGATLREVEVDGVLHKDSRDLRKRIMDAGRKYPKKQTGNELEQMIAEREAKIAAEKLQAKMQDPNLSADERELLVWKRAADAEQDAKDESKRIAEHKERPRVVKQLTEAALIRQRIVADESRELADVDFADFVLKAISDPDALPDAATSLLNELRESENARIDKAVFERESRVSALQREIEAERAKKIVPADNSDDEFEAREAERQQATKEKLAQQNAEREARFAKAMALVDAGKYEAANQLIDGVEV